MKSFVFLRKIIYKELCLFSFWIALVHFYNVIKIIKKHPRLSILSARHSSSFSFLPTNCKRLRTRLKCLLIFCNFILLSFAYLTSIKMKYTHFIAFVNTVRNIELVFKICKLFTFHYNFSLKMFLCKQFLSDVPCGDVILINMMWELVI